MKDKQQQAAEDEIVKKLDKVAGSLESTTSQLSSVVTQQQLDVLRERITKIEGDLAAHIETATSQQKSFNDSYADVDQKAADLEKLVTALDKDHTATRALTYSGFVLSTLSIIGLVVFSFKL